MPAIRNIIPCLWFDGQAEDAANFYVSVFDNATIHRIARFTDEGFEYHKQPAGQVMTVDFEIDGHKFTALNGGPDFKFTEAISFQVICENQSQIDYYWEKLGEGGDPKAENCGWLKDKFGLSWQIVPEIMEEWMADSDKSKVDRMLHVMFRMQKLDIEELQRAFEGE